MHFDDSLGTVLAADVSTASGRASVWRQLVDLIGRGRVGAAPEGLRRLAELQPSIPAATRAASARALEFAQPPAALVALFAADEASVAAPVLRSARLASAEWVRLVPTLTPGGRAILRHRRDLDAEVTRALEALGPTDFVLGTDVPADARPADLPALPLPRLAEPKVVEEQVSAEPIQLPEPEVATDLLPEPADTAAVEPEPVASDPAPAEPLPEFEQPAIPSPFVSVGTAALSVPAIAEALRHHREVESAPAPVNGGFEIADLVERIDRFQRDRDLPRPVADEAALVPSEAFRFETDADGLVRWVCGATRAALIGLPFGAPAPAAGAGVDGVAAGAFRRRTTFAGARLVVAGASDAAGHWRISGVPVFDPASGRFTGYRGTARRPRTDEQAEPRAPSAAADSLRQLVHELRTPTTAIVGFAEMIETELLGPVDPSYRARATAIRRNTEALLGTIEDLDMAARIEGGTLDLRPEQVRLAPLVAAIADDLAPLAELRGTRIEVDPFLPTRAVLGEPRAVERLIARLLATLVAASAAGERIGMAIAADGPDLVAITFDRPAALAAFTGEALFAIDVEVEDDGGAPLLGTGFALRLARNLARELGGSLVVGAERLTLRLPAADQAVVGQVFSN